MRRTRFMSVLFLVLSVSYLAMPQFRQALDTPWALVTLSTAPDKFEPSFGNDFARWKSDAQSRHDARMLAFVSLYTNDLAEATRLAGLATAVDPRYGWVYWELFGRNQVSKTPEGLALARKVQAFDPENAVGYLAEAEHIRESGDAFKAMLANVKPSFEQRFAQTEWRQAMEKAFAAKKYDSYAIARFDLERHILHEKRLDNPARVAVMLASYPIPNLLNIREYANLRTMYLGRNAEDAGKNKEALEHYWAVARFGEHMQMGGNNLIEQLIATAVQNIAYKPLIALLHKVGEDQEAASVQYSFDFLQRRNEYYSGKDILAQSSIHTWNAILVNVFLGLTFVFAALTVLLIAYVNLKRKWRAHKKGSLYGGLTIAENYMPILLFLFSTGLYISYYPYARNFQHYMTATGSMHDLESVFYNTISLPIVMPRFMQLGVGNPFVPYVWYALGAIALVVAAQFILPERKTSSEPQAKTTFASR